MSSVVPSELTMPEDMEICAPHELADAPAPAPAAAPAPEQEEEEEEEQEEEEVSQDDVYEGHADDEGVDEVVRDPGFQTESLVRLKVKSQYGQELTFTTFDDGEKKVHLTLSAPMTLPLSSLRGYVEELYPTPPPSSAPCFTAAAVIFSCVLTLAINNYLSS